jgi:hypothetical protein
MFLLYNGFDDWGKLVITYPEDSLENSHEAYNC